MLGWSATRGASPVADQPLSIANAQPEGAMAVAEILRDQGLDVREIPYLARARIADPSTTTLAITYPGLLADYQLESILDYPGDVVFVGVGTALIDSLDGGLEYNGYTVEGLRRPGCSDPDAIAAERISSGGSGVSGGEGCFADQYGAAAYVAVDRDGRRIVLLADPLLAMNEALANEGNAALVLRALGRHEHLVWYTGAPDDTTSLTWLGGPSGATTRRTGGAGRVVRRLPPRGFRASVSRLVPRRRGCRHLEEPADRSPRHRATARCRSRLGVHTRPRPPVPEGARDGPRLRRPPRRRGRTDGAAPRHPTLGRRWTALVARLPAQRRETRWVWSVCSTARLRPTNRP